MNSFKVVNNTKFFLAVKIFDVKLLLNSSVYINESSSKYTLRHIESENHAEILMSWNYANLCKLADTVVKI